MIELLHVSPAGVSNEQGEIDDEKSGSSTDTGSAVKIHMLSLNVSELVQLQGSSEKIIAVLRLQIVRYRVVDDRIDSPVFVPVAHLRPVHASLSHVLLRHDIQNSIASRVINPIDVRLGESI